MKKSYRINLRDGSSVTISDVTGVEKDGAGLRFKDEDGGVIAAFDDGTTLSHWSVDADVTYPLPTDYE